MLFINAFLMLSLYHLKQPARDLRLGGTQKIQLYLCGVVCIRSHERAAVSHLLTNLSIVTYMNPERRVNDHGLASGFCETKDSYIIPLILPQNHEMSLNRNSPRSVSYST